MGPLELARGVLGPVPQRLPQVVRVEAGVQAEGHPGDADPAAPGVLEDHRAQRHQRARGHPGPPLQGGVEALEFPRVNVLHVEELGEHEEEEPKHSEPDALGGSRCQRQGGQADGRQHEQEELQGRRMLPPRHHPEGRVVTRSRRGEDGQVNPRGQPDDRRPGEDRRDEPAPVAMAGQQPGEHAYRLEREDPWIGEERPREGAARDDRVPPLPKPRPEQHRHRAHAHQVIARKGGMVVAELDRIREGLAGKLHMGVLGLVRLEPESHRGLVHRRAADEAHAGPRGDIPVGQVDE